MLSLPPLLQGGVWAGMRSAVTRKQQPPSPCPLVFHSLVPKGKST
jgi:hypothetical protein